jgi:HAD superfamily hydrolase (TIGR01509 family)
VTVRLLGRDVLAVVFDFDGVLADTAAGWARAEAAFCRAHDVAYTAELAARTHGVALEDAVAILTGPRVAEMSAGAELLRRLAGEHVPAQARVVRGAVDVLTAVRAAHLPVAVASNSERDLLERLIEALELGDLVDVVVSASDVARPKPAPDVYLAATSLLGVAPDTAVVVEDSPTGAAAARAAGCRVVHFGEVPAASDRTSARVDSAAQVRSHRDLIVRLGLPDADPTHASEGTA